MRCFLGQLGDGRLGGARPQPAMAAGSVTVIFLCIRISREHGFLLLVVLREPLPGTGVFPVRNHFRPTGEPDRSTRKLAVGCFLVQSPQTWLGLTVVLSFNCLGFASLTDSCWAYSWGSRFWQPVPRISC